MIPVSPVTPDMTAWAVSLRDDPSFKIGMRSERVFGDVDVLAVAEVHTWWGQDPTRPAEPHKGISLYHATPDSAAAAAQPYQAQGVDVSDFQQAINWAAVRAAGVTFVISKATEGHTVEAKTFADHWAGSKKAGLVRGAYHFFRIGSTPEEQVANFFDVVGELAPPDLPPVLDVEWQHATKALDGVDAATFARRVLECLHLMADRSGRRPILYTAPGFWDLMPAGFGVVCAAVADLWVAHYGVSSTSALPGWARWAFWQYTATANEPGITTRGDGDVFCGTAAELALYARTGQLPALDPSTPIGLQVALNLLGASPPLVEDGIAGSKTRAALLAFQRQAGLPASGLVDPQTLAALRDRLG